MKAISLIYGFSSFVISEPHFLSSSHKSAKYSFWFLSFLSMNFGITRYLTGKSGGKCYVYGLLPSLPLDIGLTNFFLGKSKMPSNSGGLFFFNRLLISTYFQWKTQSRINYSIITTNEAPSVSVED